MIALAVVGLICISLFLGFVFTVAHFGVTDGFIDGWIDPQAMDTNIDPQREAGNE